MQTNNSADPPKKIDYQTELNAEQFAVVSGADGPALVLAGAGSGKTRTIVYRVAWLIEHGVSPDSILLLTFTNKAAAEMMARVEQLLGTSVRGFWGGTFHSIANRILRRAAERLGYTGAFTILDSDDAKSLLKLCHKENAPAEKNFPAPAVVMDVLSYARNAAVSIAEALDRKQPDWVECEVEFGRIAAAYAAKKKAANAMDFDDLLGNLLLLLNTEPIFADRLSEKFRYVLVDEYQDTNPIQAAIVDRLAARHRNLLVVGDDAQSIYSFRAATIDNILTFPKRFADAKIFRLETNYRSSPEILAVANEVISKNARQFPKVLRAFLPAGKKPTLVPAGTTAEEARFVAQSLTERHAAGLPLARMAVLFRAAHHSQELEFELARRGIPYEYRGGLKFFERAHVKDVVGFLKLLANPKDTVAWIRVLSMQAGIGAAGAAKIAADLGATLASIREIPDTVSSLVPGRAMGGWREVRGIFAQMISAPTPAETIRAVATSAYAQYLAAEYPNASDRLEDLEEFAKFAEGFENLEQFLAEVTLKDDYGAVKAGGSEAGRDKLVLSTIHQAKGLEWDVVHLIRLLNGSFPHSRALLEPNGIEEERRLFYVAVTRAKKALCLSYPVTAGYDDLAVASPSPFINEIDCNLLDGARLAARRANPWGSATVFDEGTDFAAEDTIELDRLGEPKKKPPRRGGLLRSVEEL